MMYVFSVYLVFYQKTLNWLFGHYKTLTTLLSNEFIVVVKITKLGEIFYSFMGFSATCSH